MASKLMQFCSFTLVRKCLQLGLLAALLSLPAQAGTLPTLVMPEGVGINIHFTRGHEKELDMIAAAGIRVVRTDLKWDETENYKGVYDWSAYDELAANLAKRGMRPLFILDYSNALYEKSTPKIFQSLWSYHEVMSPRSPSSIAAFARWAAAAERHFSKYNVIWEIWNEPNIKFWKPKPNVEEYARLAMATCNAIRAVNTNATVIAPAASSFPWDFLEGLFKAGVLSCLDGVSVHPYRLFKLPETVTEDYARLRKLIEQYTPANIKKTIPILSGEWGYPTVIRGIPLEDQADLAVRMQLINLLNGVPLSIWYDWKNDGQEPGNYEHNFGIVGSDLTLKPAYDAIKTLTAQLTGYRLVQRVDIGHRDNYALLFANAKGHSKLVVWTAGRANNVRIAAPTLPRNTQLTLIDGRGLRSALKLDGNWISIRLTNSPAYIAP